jgi:GxxExxY protein
MEDTKKKFMPLSEKEELLATQIVDSAYTVHKNLGPGLLEKVYEACFCYELTKRKLSYQKQVNIPIKYDNLYFDEGLRLDVLVEGLIICELKAIEQYNNKLWEAQLLSYLKISDKRLGFIINFDVPRMTGGIKRIIL